MAEKNTFGSLYFVQGKEEQNKKVASLQNCVHRENGVRIPFKTLVGRLVEFPLPQLNVDIIWYQ
jgi:hypothetical protein